MMDKMNAALVSRGPAPQAPPQQNDLTQKLTDLIADKGPMEFSEIMKGASGLKSLVPLTQDLGMALPLKDSPNRPTFTPPDFSGHEKVAGAGERPATIAERPELQSAPARETPFDAGDFTPPGRRDDIARLSPGALFAGLLTAASDTSFMADYGRPSED